MSPSVKASKLYKYLVATKHRLDDNRINRSDFHTDSKIIVVESDDWGSIRTPSASVLKDLVEHGDPALNDPFLKNDSLESSADLEQLFDTLRSIRDANGRPLPITANFAMANADFEKIRETGTYAREPFYETYERYYDSQKPLKLVLDGYKNGLLMPQLHCLEHLNVIRWMRDYQQKKPDTITAFDHHMYGIGASFTETNKYGYMDAFNYQDPSERAFLSESLKTATSIFEQTFGYKSSSFTASCYIWDDFLEAELCKLGIYHLQSGISQILPFYASQSEQYRTMRHRTGERNAFGQIYTVRNCEFEPTFHPNNRYQTVRCLEQIDHAFQKHVPAIISSHRLNFIGSINPNNRTFGLESLKTLFEQVLKKHPDVVFMTSDQLGAMIQKK
ncbi:MAG: hypothetical protein IJW29_01950 [Clostridia bacterium]|nr:hypothetical protein [Clostridia bacterium]